jgi:ATP-binding cassette subfamily B (MDR/TAP) protein 1
VWDGEWGICLGRSGLGVLVIVLVCMGCCEEFLFLGVLKVSVCVLCSSACQEERHRSIAATVKAATGMASQANLPNLPTGELASEKTTMLQRLAAKIPGLRPDAAEKQTRPSYLSLLFHSGPEPLDHVLLTIGVLAALAAGVPFPLLGILFGELVDDMGSASCAADDTSSFGLSAAIERKVLLVVYVTIANFAVIYVHTSCWSMLSERLVRRIRHRYLSAMLRQEMAFFDTLPAGEVASRLDTDLQNIQSGTAEKVGICISSFSYFVAAYAVSFVKAPKLAGMLISIVPAFLMMAMGGGHFVKKFSGRGSDHIAKATGIASAGLTNIMVVHAFGAGKRLEGLFAEHLGNAQVEGIKKSVVSAIQLGLLYFIAYSANALAFWQGSRLIGDSVSGGDTGTTVGAVYTVIFVLVDGEFAAFIGLTLEHSLDGKLC